MKRRSTCLALAVVATLAIAGCGKDNNDNNGGGGGTPVPTRTSTPAGPVKTATPVSSVSTSTTPGTSPSTSTSTSPASPGPTSTPTGTGACEATSMTLTVTSEPGSVLDTGWTGISHGQPALEQTTITVDLDCARNPECDVHGEALAGTKFGSPLPLSAGGVGVCVINTFREGVTGTYNCETGCGTSSVKLTSSVIQSALPAKPCPNCLGTDTPNDGVKGGTCDSGATPGAPCDVGGINPTFGATSNDCLPSADPIGNLAINIDPLTTGTVTTSASTPCSTARFGSTCFVASQDRPNACTAPSPAGTCPASGTCDDPVDAFCSGAKFQSCSEPGSTADCVGFPNGGTCETAARPCFGTTITRTGQCGTQNGVLVGFFEIPATSAPAVNTVSGLPGPGAVSLPVSSVRRPK